MALLDYEICITELMHRALRFAPVMPGESGKASYGHLKAPPRQATKTVPNITNNAAKRHLRQPEQSCKAYKNLGGLACEYIAGKVSNSLPGGSTYGTVEITPPQRRLLLLGVPTQKQWTICSCEKKRILMRKRVILAWNRASDIFMI
jgi:hypothetical protein